jgi:hypothetical protein
MSGGADDHLYIGDANEAGRALANMNVVLTNLHQTVTGVIKDLTAAEAGKPWGTDADIGGKYEASYNKTAPILKENTPKIVSYAAEGHHLGFVAIMKEAAIDKDAAQTIKDKIDGQTMDALNGSISQMSGGVTAPDMPKEWTNPPKPENA